MKNLFTVLIVLLIGSYCWSQTTGINYKALVKDSGGNVVANQSIIIQFQILQGSGMTNVYHETHSPTTNSNGIVVVNIGQGVIDSGVFDNINWSNDDHFLNVQIDTGSGLTDLGTTQFMAVPYALSAKNIPSNSIEINDLIDGKTHTNGSSIYLGKEAGLNDSSDIGLNVGVGFEALKNSNGGGANAAVGYEALLNNTLGGANVAVGFKALVSNQIGDGNIAIGYLSLVDNTEGINNTAVGLQTLRYNLGDANTAIGTASLENNNTGEYNIALGYASLVNNTVGEYNLAMGRLAGYGNIIGNKNIFLGNYSGYYETDSSKLYIENTDADPDNALIYGEFGADNTTVGNIFRTNSEFQIGNPTTNGYAFPITDGAINQVLQTDGNGNLSWINNSISDSPFSTVNNVTSNSLGDSSNDDFVFGSVLLDDDPNITTDDNRMFFDKSKGAFRAGKMSSVDWDENNVGDYSAAFGSAKASGSYSFAAGVFSEAIGSWSTAFGTSTASGNGGAFASGNSSLASGSVSFAHGVSVEASGSDAIAMGRLSTATNQGTIALGYQANSVGLQSSTFGYQVTASGSYAMSLGRETEASGFESLAMGKSTIASGTNSTAFGEATVAAGTNSIAFGVNSSAVAKNSIGIGYGLNIESPYSIGIGRYNVGGTSSTVSWEEIDPLFEIGNGSDDSDRTNALTVLKNGTITAPSLTNSLIETAGNKALITKEYADTNYSGGSGGASSLNDLTDVKVENDGFNSTMFIGINSGLNDDGGNANLSLGFETLKDNTSGSGNMALGHHSLWKNTTGGNNISIGTRALENSISGSHNIAVGNSVLTFNTSGYDNTAIGYQSMLQNNSGYHNTAIGQQSLSNNTTGWDNTAVGYYALLENNGYYNTAVGKEALRNNSSGYRNVAIGFQALYNNTTGHNNIAIGSHAAVPDPTGSYQVRIGSSGITYAGIQVAWTVTSDSRWKDKTRKLPYGLNMVTQLNPVDYIRKNNNKQTREIGFIAQEVEEVLEKLGYDDQGFLTKDDKGLMSLRYNDFIAILTKAIQEQQDIIEEQRLNLEKQDKEITSLTAEQKATDERLNKIEEFLKTSQQ